MNKILENIGNRYYEFVTIEKSLIKINMQQLWASKIYEYIGKRLAVNGNHYFTNRYRYRHTYVSCNEFVSEMFVIKVTVKENPFQLKSSTRLVATMLNPEKKINLDLRRYISSVIKTEVSI